MPSVAPTKEVPTAAGGRSKSPTLTRTGTPHFSSSPLSSHPCSGRPRLSLPQYSPTRDSPASYVSCRPAHSHLPAPRTMRTHTPSLGSPLTPDPDSLAIKSRQVPRSNTDASAPSIMRGVATAADIPVWPQWAGPMLLAHQTASQLSQAWTLWINHLVYPSYRKLQGLGKGLGQDHKAPRAQIQTRPQAISPRSLCSLL